MQKLKHLCIIPARGGSKRIPRKNIKEFCGKPIIAYSIEAALKSKLFDEVMVSTDDDEIKRVAEKFGAKVPFVRSREASNDHATLAEVLLEVLGGYAQREVEVESICCILPTAPLLCSGRLIEAYDAFVSGKFNSLIPVVRYSYPIQRALKECDGRLLFFDEQFATARSQDLEPSYHDVGQFYFAKTASLLSEKTLFTTKTAMVELSEMEVQDIDTPEDWKVAEFKFKYLGSKK